MSENEIAFNSHVKQRRTEYDRFQAACTLKQTECDQSRKAKIDRVLFCKIKRKATCEAKGLIVKYILTLILFKIEAA